MTKKLPKEIRDYRRKVDPEQKTEKSSIPFAIFLVILFLVAYLLFSNTCFA